ncbi:hypothetical protein [Thermodesulfovibrio thiophilus]|uniref:hypothetical protein n=1 Tax=Thermodesulfovibrio thiophilus TaxID=340095 RepID=UPI0003F4E3B9|nr:hypothetical protein [Thermodesulfovibrio thiophilus]
MDNKILRGSCSLVFVIFLLLFNWISSVYGEIIAKPGTFDHFQLDTPDKFIAGSEYKIFIYALDAFGNSVSMPSESPKEYKLAVSGFATITPSQFKSSEITQSGLAIKFKDERAEDVLLTLYEINSPFPILEKRIKILPAQLYTLKIKVPPSVRVGRDFDIQITGNDRFGNVVCQDFDPKALNLFFKGDVAPQIKDIRYVSERCYVNVKLFAERTGYFQIEANLLDKKITGKSEKVEILNGEVTSFIVNAPSEAVVNEPFDVTILAIDNFNNFVKDFAMQREKIIIEAQGKSSVFLSELSSYAFSDGKAKISLRYDKPEDIKIVVKIANDNNIKGESDIVKLIPPKVKRFEVISPDTIIAGQRFKIKIIAYNQLDKIMSNYNLYGNTVILKSSGTGTLTPNKIPASEFVNGVATVNVMYDKAENFEIYATTEEKESPSKEIKVSEERPVEKTKQKVMKKKEVKETRGKKKGTALKGNVLELKNVSLVETKSGCILTLFVPNIEKQGSYYPRTQKTTGAMAVVLEIYPATNQLETPVKIDSEFIKKVSVVEEQNNKLVLNIILKKPLKYRLLKKKDELVVEFRKR